MSPPGDRQGWFVPAEIRHLPAAQQASLLGELCTRTAPDGSLQSPGLRGALLALVYGWVTSAVLVAHYFVASVPTT